MDFHQRRLLLALPLIVGILFLNSLTASSKNTSKIGIKLKPAPVRLQNKPRIIVEWHEILEECAKEKVCVQGQLLNEGGKTAYNTKLRIDLGGTKYIKPRARLWARLSEAVMRPGDRQEFYLEINRKVPYKHKRKQKIFEVGKYNFQIVPLWSKKKPK